VFRRGASIALQAVLALGFLWAAQPAGPDDLHRLDAEPVGGGDGVGLVRLRLREGAAAVPCAGWPFVPCTFLAAVLWFALAKVVASPTECLLGLGTLLLAGLLARAARRS
jgi:hypothetical protein